MKGKQTHMNKEKRILIWKLRPFRCCWPRATWETDRELVNVVICLMGIDIITRADRALLSLRQTLNWLSLSLCILCIQEKMSPAWVKTEQSDHIIPIQIRLPSIKKLWSWQELRLFGSVQNDQKFSPKKWWTHKEKNKKINDRRGSFFFSFRFAWQRARVSSSSVQLRHWMKNGRPM